MAKLAFFGHPKRGSEIIQILQMLGGKGVGYGGYGTEFYYYIDEYGNISISTKSDDFKEYKVFTLEEFLEKYPYKVGERVIIKCKNQEAIVDNVFWGCDTITYWLKYNGIIEGNWRAEDLQPYKEETMEENLTIQDIKENNAEWLLNKLQEMSAEGALQTISDLYDKLHTPQYPKTYEECAKLLNTYCGSIGGYNWKLLSYFQQLIICRDAYWKIAGEQMGLGEPWKPDWKDEVNTYYTIHYNGTDIKLYNYTDVYSKLAFPTAEMRDAFYENFKDLIEQCKELL